MAGIAAVLMFAIAFVLYAVKAHPSVPWTPEGFALLGLALLAVHSVWPWYAWRRRAAAGPPP